MDFTEFPQVNRRLGPPPSMTDEECGTLPVWTDGRVCVSCWKPTEEERAKLAAGEPIWLWVWGGGGTQPPVALSVDDPWATSDDEEAAQGI